MRNPLSFKLFFPIGKVVFLSLLTIFFFSFLKFGDDGFGIDFFGVVLLGLLVSQFHRHISFTKFGKFSAVISSSPFQPHSFLISF